MLRDLKVKYQKNLIDLNKERNQLAKLNNAMKI